MFLWLRLRTGTVSLIDSVLGVVALSGSDVVSVGGDRSLVVYSQSSQSSSTLSLSDLVGVDGIRCRRFLRYSCPSGVRMLYDLGSDAIEVMTAGIHFLPTLTRILCPG